MLHKRVTRTRIHSTARIGHDLARETPPSKEVSYDAFWLTFLSEHQERAGFSGDTTLSSRYRFLGCMLMQRHTESSKQEWSCTGVFYLLSGLSAASQSQPLPHHGCLLGALAHTLKIASRTLNVSEVTMRILSFRIQVATAIPSSKNCTILGSKRCLLRRARARVRMSPP